MLRLLPCVFLGIALKLVACSRSGVTSGADATPDGTSPQTDAAIITTPDAAIVATPDAAIVTTPDAAIVNPPDAAVVTTPDAAMVNPPDAAIVSPPDTASVTTPDSGPLLRDTGTVSTDPFGGHSFSLDSMNPAPTPDPACNKVQPAEYFILDFGPTLQTLTIRWVQGSAMTKIPATPRSDADKLTYHLGNPTGGTLTLERDQGVYVGQITLYGSGVPVITCLRAALSPQP